MEYNINQEFLNRRIKHGIKHSRDYIDGYFKILEEREKDRIKIQKIIMDAFLKT